MLENIKLDIIYYNTQKDFEMEFNLCGCCRMRLLTAVADDLKGFANCIKVAVARSRVVLLCGKLDGDDGIFNIISRAVGREFEEVENSVYGIANEGKTKLLKQSIPLVCNDGTFLGCVIEQGPQAIIMISDLKNGRKEIMQNLVHPYVKELSKSEIIVNDETEYEEVVAPDITDDFAAKASAEDDVAKISSDTVLKNLEMQIDEETESIDAQLENEDNCEDLEDNEIDEELETISLDDFPSAEDNNVSEKEPITIDENVTEEDVVNDEGEEPDVLENEKSEDNTKDLGLVFGIPNDNFDESEQKLYSSDVMEEYNSNYSLIGYDDKFEQSRRHRRPAASPLVLILLCVIICLLAIIIYYLFAKPALSGMAIDENFNSLFSFAKIGVKMPW